MSPLQSTLSPLAGKLAPVNLLVDIPRLITDYYTKAPDPEASTQKVIFGTSGHRGSSLNKTFNEAHILAITYAIILYRNHHQITGPLFLGIDTHALSIPAFTTAMEVLAAHGVHVVIAKKNEYTPTPVISHAILNYNRGRTTGYADGIVITPSHNPPQDGGFKYNPPDGGPAETIITRWIENKANQFLANAAKIKRISIERALKAATTEEYDFLDAYVQDLDNVIRMQAIAAADIRIGVNPLGGAGIHYWERIAERYQLNLSLFNHFIDPTFRFMSVDWDGKIRMDPSSPYAMAASLKYKDHFDLSLVCDTDYDRHGIITPAGLMTPNQYLCAALYYLLQHRPDWPETAAIGKTIVDSQMMDKIALDLNRPVYEVPVGFKWFSKGLLDSTLAFACEESAGASFQRRNGRVWTTDKDGFICTLLAAEILAVSGKNPAVLYQELEQRWGKSFYQRIDHPATPAQKQVLKNLNPANLQYQQLAGEPIHMMLTQAPGNGASIDGIKIIAEQGWFVVRPSGTEDIYKLYAESFKSEDHLAEILVQAQQIIQNLLGA